MVPPIQERHFWRIRFFQNHLVPKSPSKCHDLSCLSSAIVIVVFIYFFFRIVINDVILFIEYMLSECIYLFRLYMCFNTASVVHNQAHPWVSNPRMVDASCHFSPPGAGRVLCLQGGRWGRAQLDRVDGRHCCRDAWEVKIQGTTAAGLDELTMNHNDYRWIVVIQRYLDTIVMFDSIKNHTHND